MSEISLKSLSISKLSDKTPLKNPQNIFLLCALTFGLLMIFITPPFQGSDENVHFLRSVQITNFEMSVSRQGDVVGGYIDKGYIELINVTLKKPRITFHPDIKMNRAVFREASQIKLTHQYEFTKFGGTASNPPITYFPAAIFIKIGSLLGLRPLAIFYLARIGSFLSWILAVYLAIKIIPTNKIALAIINFVPMIMFQSSIVTADTMTFAALSLFIAEVVRLRYKKQPLSRSDWIRLILTLMLLSVSKKLMFCFAPLILLIRPKANTAKIRFIQTAIITASVPFSLAWGMLMRFHLGPQFLNGPKADPAAQISFLKESPLAILRVTFNSFFTSAGNKIYQELFGIFGWLDTPLPLWIAMVSMLVTFAAITRRNTYSLASQYKAQALELWEKILVFVACISYFMAVNLAMYIYYTAPKHPTYAGLQGRYFLPIMIASLLFFIGPHKNEQEYIVSQRQLVLFSQLILIASVATIAIRYYIS